MHSRIDPVVDPQLPREQAGFSRGRSTVDQLTLGRGLESLLTSLNSAHIGSDLTLMVLDDHPTEMQGDRVIYLAGQLNI